MRQQPPSLINRKSGHISFATSPETTTLTPPGFPARYYTYES